MSYRAILIAGGGVRGGGELPVWVMRRLDRAIELAGPDTLFIPLSAGTTHRRPPLDRAGFPILESIAAAEYLVRRGIDRARIFPETISLDTIGNAYFAKIQQVDPLGIRTLLIVTSDFHIARTEAVFRWVFGMEGGYELAFEAVPDDAIEPGLLAARRAKEAESIRSVGEISSRIRTLAELHRWLYTAHAAYAAGLRPIAGEAPPDSKLVDSY